jgi:hypothetical protein
VTAVVAEGAVTADLCVRIAYAAIASLLIAAAVAFCNNTDAF